MAKISPTLQDMTTIIGLWLTVTLSDDVPGFSTVKKLFWGWVPGRVLPSTLTEYVGTTTLKMTKYKYRVSPFLHLKSTWVKLPSIQYIGAIIDI